MEACLHGIDGFELTRASSGLLVHHFAHAGVHNLQEYKTNFKFYPCAQISYTL